MPISSICECVMLKVGNFFSQNHLVTFPFA